MSWLRRISNTFRTGHLRRDIDRELAFHVTEREDALRAEGLSGDEARRQARLQFGNPAAQIERTRDVDVSGTFDAFLRNVRHAVRGLWRTPGFTVTVVLTLALGIGANTAVFSAIDAIVLRPLPYADADRLVELHEVGPGGERLVGLPRLADWNRLNTTFDVISGYSVRDGSDTRRDPPERTQYAAVAPGFFELLGVTPALGRGFTADDHRQAGPTPILLSDRFWRQSYAADPAVVGTTIRIRDISGELTFPIAGVMGDSFLFLARGVGAWSPLKPDAPWFQRRNSDMSFVNGVGRLKPGVTLAQARTDLARVQAQLGRQYPDTDRDVGVLVTPLKATVIGDAGRSLWLLFGAVTVLLLIACTNIASLLLARGAQREQEIAVRYSLGGTRAAVAMQLLTEAAVVAVAGAAAGLAVAAAATAGLRRLAPDLPRLDEVGLDARILAYTIVVTMAVALACGLLPAIRSSRGGRSLARAHGTRVSSRHAVQWVLVGAQVALSVTLLAGAGLLLRSFDALARVDRGFDATRVLAFRVYGAYGGESQGAIVQRIERTLDELATLPGVAAAATATMLPGLPVVSGDVFALVERRSAAEAELPAHWRGVSPDVFRTLQIPIVRGTTCGRLDPAAAGLPRREALVNRRFVERYLPGREPVGLHLRRDTTINRIVGVVADTREAGMDRDPVPAVYECMNINPVPWYLVRTAGDPAVLAAAVRQKVQEIEPLRPVYDVAPLVEQIDAAYAETRMRTVLLTLFAGTALALACLGVYGTLSYIVRLRRREVGLRLALGAGRGGILRQFVAQGLRVAIAACACGIGLSLLFTRLLSGMLYGVTPSDPATLSGVVAVVLAMSVLAALIPAARAALLQPMRTLREE